MKTRIIIGLFFLTVYGLQSCRYKDGPNFTLRSAKARLTNTWKLNHYIDNGVDQTSTFNTLSPNYTLVIKDDGEYVITTTFIIPLKETGQWSFNNEKTEFNLKKNGTGTNIWKITKLKTKELWAEQTDSKNHLIQYHLIAD